MVWCLRSERRGHFLALVYGYRSAILLTAKHVVSYFGTMPLSNKHHKTLIAIFEKPTLANIRWSEVEQLFIALGAEITEGQGSRVRIKLNDQVVTFHRPHPGKEARRYAVEAAREFLRNHDIEP